MTYKIEITTDDRLEISMNSFLQKVHKAFKKCFGWSLLYSSMDIYQLIDGEWIKV
jgi:hypothetical protein